MTRSTGEDDFTHREWLLVFDEVVTEFRKEMKDAGREGEFIGAKVWDDGAGV